MYQTADQHHRDPRQLDQSTARDPRLRQKVRENRLRRVAARQGLALMRSPRRDRRAVDYGSYQLVDRATGRLVYGSASGYGLPLASVQLILGEPVLAAVNEGE